LLSKSGTLVQIGGVGAPYSVSKFPLMMTRKSIAESLIEEIRDTQEVIDLCHEHKIYPDCQQIEAKEIDSTLKKEILFGKT
jgi:uncharacterized zinc-type alcohol dehydrogenase-like protein